MTFSFSIEANVAGGLARAGWLRTSHGTIATPVFMPVGTQGTVKTLTPKDLLAVGAHVVLANTYHLYLRPGSSLIAQCGGAHRFMAWPRPLLTDSGGFQVLSLRALRRISDHGVIFQSHIDGSEHVFTPEKAIAIQEDLGADIIMAFDECPPFAASRAYHREALDRTHNWAERCLAAHQGGTQALFGIVQGGTYVDLRTASATFLSSLGFPGYALGGLSVGEPKELTWAMVDATLDVLPHDKPRYLMGVGSPEDLITAVDHGIDMLDSVLPARIARNGAVFTRHGRQNLRNARFRLQPGPIEEDCDCYACRAFDVAYLHHLFRCGEPLGYRLATIHNLRHVLRLAGELRLAVIDGSFAARRDDLLAAYCGSAPVPAESLLGS